MKPFTTFTIFSANNGLSAANTFTGKKKLPVAQREKQIVTAYRSTVTIFYKDSNATSSSATPTEKMTPAPTVTTIARTR